MMAVGGFRSAATDLSLPVVLRDSAGTIVGADFADTSSLPANLAAGEKGNATAFLAVSGGEPVSVEAYALG